MITEQPSVGSKPAQLISQSVDLLRRRLVRDLTINALRRLVRTGTLTVIEPGASKLRFGAGKPDATIVLRSSAVWAAFASGGNGLARAYADGLWDSPDLVALSALAAVNLAKADRRRRLMSALAQKARPQPVQARGANGHGLIQRYEVSTDLYKLMLGADLNRSCAYFEHADMSLADAHVANHDLICDQLKIGPRDHVLEFSGGWGTFALHVARTRGCRVTTNIPDPERAQYARDAAEQAGLAKLVTVRQQPFDQVEGQFDKIVAIELFQAVDSQQIRAFLKRCNRLLSDDGSMLLQTITVDDRAHPIERLAGSFMTEQLFLGHTPPSLQSLTLALASKTDLQVAGVRDLTAHYVKTLRHRRVRFLARAAEVTELGYDNRFQRLWTLYLAYGEGAFSQRRMNALQLLLVKPSHRTALPS